MLMIVFGAGASYDSDPRHPSSSDYDGMPRPPLASQLFSERFAGHFWGHRDCAALFHHLRQIVDNGTSSIENELESMHTDAERYPHLRRATFALRSYIQDVIRHCVDNWMDQTKGVTGHVVLLNEIAKWRHNRQDMVCIVTFNYDTLIESACADVLGLKFADISTYVADPRYELFKLHGSIDWGRQVRNVRGTILDSVAQFAWTDEYRVSTSKYWDPPYQPTEDPTTMYVPAIAVPTVSKSGFECPPAHIEVLTSVIPLVTHLLVIGWRGMEEHFLSLWRQGPISDASAAFPARLERLQIVSGSKDGAEEVRRRLADEAGIRCADERVAGEGFSQFLESGALTSFLY